MDLTNFGATNHKKPKEISDKNLELDFNEMKKDFDFIEEERYLPWFLKYQLKSFDDLIKTKEIMKIVKFFKEANLEKGLLLYGPAGCGKTTTLNLIGNYFDYEIFELNASDARNKKSILESVGSVVQQKSLFGKNKLILIDEVDGVSGTYDRGGVAEIIKILKTSNYPVVFTANDSEATSIKSLKKVCEVIDFSNHSFELLLGIGKKILTSENISFDDESLGKFVEERNSNDIRGFINDLQASVFDGKFLNDNSLDIRNYKKEIEELLNKIFFSYPEDSVFASFNSNVNIDDLFLYLEENIPEVYDKMSTFKAFNELSKADQFRGRIRKWQYWRYLVYVNFYLTYGVSSSKNNLKKVKYKKNGRILKKWIYNNKMMILSPRTKIQKEKDEEEKLVEKLAKFYGRSVKKFRSEDLWYFLISYRNNPEFRGNINFELNIDKKTEESLMKL